MKELESSKVSSFKKHGTTVGYRMSSRMLVSNVNRSSLHSIPSRERVDKEDIPDQFPQPF